MQELISVIIPNFNGEKTLELCLESVYKSTYENFEVIVVDDGSADNSVQIIEKFPCTLLRNESRLGAAHSRNRGALAAQGDILFFTDSDCVLQTETLSKVSTAMKTRSSNTVIGGSYSPQAYDKNFFSHFQSVFVNHFELKKASPDYIATHAMALRSKLFCRHQGFKQPGLPILEDVEFSHRLSRQGVQLRMAPEIQVQHIFNFTLSRSLSNAARKSKYWLLYSLRNKDLHKNSGTASLELKVNGLLFFPTILSLILLIPNPNPILFLSVLLAFSVNALINHSFLFSIFKHHGTGFTLLATAYYFLVYPAAIWAGSLAAIKNNYFSKQAMGV